MKKLTKYLFIITLFFISIPYVLAKDTTLYFFYGEGCPHCAKEEIFLKEMEEKYQNLKIKRYETYGNLDNKGLMNQYKQKFGVTARGIPFTVVGENYVYGYSDTYREKIENMIREDLGLEKITYETNSNLEKEEKEEIKEEQEISTFSNKTIIVILTFFVLVMSFILILSKTFLSKKYVKY